MIIKKWKYLQNSLLKMYNRKLYINVLIKMAKKGTRVVVTLECTEARTSTDPKLSLIHI